MKQPKPPPAIDHGCGTEIFKAIGLVSLSRSRSLIEHGVSQKNRSTFFHFFMISMPRPKVAGKLDGQDARERLALVSQGIGECCPIKTQSSCLGGRYGYRETAMVRRSTDLSSVGRCNCCSESASPLIIKIRDKTSEQIGVAAPLSRAATSVRIHGPETTGPACDALNEPDRSCRYRGRHNGKAISRAS
jgi:hypothetical protein